MASRKTGGVNRMKHFMEQVSFSVVRGGIACMRQFWEYQNAWPRGDHELLRNWSAKSGPGSPLQPYFTTCPVIWVPAPLALDLSLTPPSPCCPLSLDLWTLPGRFFHSTFMQAMATPSSDLVSSFTSSGKTSLSLSCVYCFLYSNCIAILLVDIYEHNYSTAIL